MIDQVIVCIYLIITLMIGLLVGRDTRSISDFAIGKRNFPTVVLLSTVFATVIGAGSTLGLSKSIFSEGLTYWISHLGVVLGYLLLALFVAPRFDPFLGLLSSGDILGKMYGVKAKIFMGFATIFESILLTAMQILAISHIMQYFFDISLQASALFAVGIIAIYSTRGGIRAVTATDVFQFGILIIAIPLVSGIALSKIGGFNGLFLALKNPPKNFPETDHMKHLVTFIFFAFPAIFPRTMQRMLMAKNVQQIRTTFITHSALCILFYVTVAIIGISAWYLLPNIEPRFVFPGLINEILPIGIKGFVISGLLAVFMSSIDSDLNLASIAVAHDIAAPLSKNISEKTKLKIARISTIIVSLMAACAALYFNSYMKIIYFILCLSNSAFFPGYLLGFLGFNPGKKGFWIGLSSAMTSVILLTIVFDLFILYTGLISISLNIAILIGFHFKERYSSTDREIVSTPIAEPVHSEPHNALFQSEYCTIFAISTLISGLLPFFLLSPHSKLESSPHLFVSALSVIFSFMLTFRETWKKNGQKLFKPLLYATLAISLPSFTLLMWFTDYSLIWTLDLITCFALLFILTNKKSTWLIGITGLVIAVFLSFLSAETELNTSPFAYWMLASHVITLVCYLFLFRRQDAQRYKILTGKLAHETSRSMSSLSVSAEFLKLNIPKLVNGYEWAHHNGYSGRDINTNMLDELNDLPNRLQEMGQRTAKTVDALVGKVRTSQEQNIIPNNIFICVKNAINDPSITSEQRNKIILTLDHTFSFFGDQEQVSQAILNIIENALHAIAKKDDGQIKIWAKGKSLFIQDNGIGISHKNLPNIFDDFFSTKKTRGQGLAFCKQVMSEHGGDIYCESEENCFTQFELSL